MKNLKKSIIFLMALSLILLMVPTFSNAATREVTNEDTLNTEISNADPGDTIVLKNDITVTKPIVIAKALTIDGNGHNVVGSNDWTSTSGNQTMFTAQFSDAKLTLKNINLKNGPKYGVQSYDGATVILDNVSITGFKYGGVLANGGNVEVIDLHLGYNGTGSNNGIEIDKGAAATNNPSLTMNGTLTSDSAENVVRPAENGNLTDFTITNTPNTTNKVVIAGDKVVLTDKDNNVISETALPENAKPSGDIQNIIITLVANEKTSKIVVDSGATITADMLKSHIKLDEGYQIDGFYTDAQYTNEFDFNNPLTSDTTIYTKISKIETTAPEATGEKDETPKTGIENYNGVAILAIIFATTGIIYMRKKK